MNTSLRQYLFIGGIVVLFTPLLRSDVKAPRMSGAEFDQKLTIDHSRLSETHAAGGSYADVVQRILPSVVSISTYSRRQAQIPDVEVYTDDLRRIPPMFRDFFRDLWDRRHSDAPRQRRHLTPNKKPVQTGLGSGVIITADGYILTNNHVVDDVDELRVRVAGRGSEFIATVIGADPQTDVALIKIDAAGLSPATIGDSSQLRVGDMVLAVGSPMGLDQSVTHGIVSGLGRSELGIIGSKDKDQAGYENFIQTDAAINPGNSGGPLLDAQGRVVGLNAAIETRSGMFAGIGLAIPISMAVSAARDLLEGGAVQRGYVGIQMESLDASMAEYLQLERGGGVIVTSVVAGSPAFAAGFLEGDAIITINDQNVISPAQLRLAVSAQRPGARVRFGVVRYNTQTKAPQHLELTAVLQALPVQAIRQPAESAKDDESPGDGKHFIKGVTIENLNEDTRDEYDIAKDVEGVVVTGDDGPSVLQEGDVILEVNHRPVKNTTEAMAAKAGIMHLKILREGKIKFVIVKE